MKVEAPDFRGGIGMEVLFSLARRSTIFGRVIGWWTKGEYSHAELRFSDGWCFSSNLQGRSGTGFNMLRTTPDRYHAVLIECDSETEAKVRKFCIDHVAQPYDWHGVLAYVFPWAKDKQNAWYCSEICAAALINAGLLKQTSDDLSPSNLFKLLVEQGYRVIEVRDPFEEVAPTAPKNRD